MAASEPLPHFVDDLLGYLHETHPTYATLDGVHAHDDLLEDLSRQGIDAETRALSGYLRRLEEIDAQWLTAVEKLEHRMLADHLRLDRCYVSEVFEQEGYSTVGPEHVRPGLPSMVGTYRLTDYPETMRQLATQPMIVHDSETDSRFSDAEKAMLALVPESWLVVAYVMVAQALSGIAKDLTKMSSKSAVKLVVPEGESGALYKWVAILTGSKNALKGVGFFVGGLLLSLVGFQTALLILAGLVLTALVGTLTLMRGDLGTPNAKAKFRQMFSHNRAVNVLAGARIFLFASRDVWFVVGADGALIQP